MRLDTHQHFWELANSFTLWPTPDLKAIHRDYRPDDLRSHLAGARIDGTILVQAAPSVEETEYCLELAQEFDFVKGVVGWIDFEAADVVDQLGWLASNPYLKGLRPMVQSIDETNWLLKPEFAPAFDAMLEWGLVLEGLVLPHQLAQLDSLARRYPDLLIVLNHAGKPPIASRHHGQSDEWYHAIAILAENRNVHCKLSGLWTEANGNTSTDFVRPWVTHLLGTFGPGRLIWGSDWPVLELAGTYGDWLSQSEALLSHLSQTERAAIFGGNGKQVYGID